MGKSCLGVGIGVQGVLVLVFYVLWPVGLGLLVRSELQMKRLRSG